MNVNMYKEYCTGCGLCKAVLGTEIQADIDGFPIPDIKKENDFYSKVCPVGRKNTSDSIWGDYIEYLLGYASDSNVRKRASSGGILTAVAIYLIKNKIVDGVIHVEADSVVPYRTQVTISREESEILRHTGSRYSASSPLINITKMVQKNERYAFIGKPCDVAALKAYMKEFDVLKNIIYTFSFFCAGVPSEKAQIQLLNKLGCADVKDCERLNYRGNGWPGYATCYFKNGKTSTMTYDESWGQVLGRDVKKICRFCMDGIGNSADISCCDAWLLTEDNIPDFTEAEGRNAIFVRSNKGEELLNQVKKSGQIVCESASIEDLKYIQTYQYERRATMIDRIVALCLMRKDVPKYSVVEMLKLANKVGIRKHVHIFKGTIQRIKKGKI